MVFDPETFDILPPAIQRLTREPLVPAESDLEAHDKVPADFIDDMKKMGLFGLTAPEEYGDIGLSVGQEVLVNYALGRTEAAFRSVFGTNIGIGSQGVLIDDTPEQKAESLPRVASGALIMSFALTDPDAGTNAASLKTRAKFQGDYYVLNGTKRFITDAPRAGAFMLMARTGGPGAGGVPACLPGLTLGKNDKKMGQRGTRTCNVILENVRVPAASIIGGVPGQRFKNAMKVLDRGHLNLSAVSCGPASRVIDESRRYARQRKLFGKAIGVIQLLQAMLSYSQADLLTCWPAGHWCRPWRSASIRNRPRCRPPDVSVRVSCAKFFATEMGGRVADRGVQIHRGASCINE